MGGLDCGFRRNDGRDADLPNVGATLVVARFHVGAHKGHPYGTSFCPLKWFDRLTMSGRGA